MLCISTKYFFSTFSTTKRPQKKKNIWKQCFLAIESQLPKLFDIKTLVDSPKGYPILAFLGSLFYFLWYVYKKTDFVNSIKLRLSRLFSYENMVTSKVIGIRTLILFIYLHRESTPKAKTLFCSAIYQHLLFCFTWKQEKSVKNGDKYILTTCLVRKYLKAGQNTQHLY